MNNHISDYTYTGIELGAMLRSENKELRTTATEYIQERAEGSTDAERAKALGVSSTTFGAWRREGLVKGFAKAAKGRQSRSPTEPTKLELGKQWLIVDWVQGSLGAGQKTRPLRKAEIRTSTGKGFTMASWEGTKFVEAMVSLGWSKS